MSARRPRYASRAPSGCPSRDPRTPRLGRPPDLKKVCATYGVLGRNAAFRDHRGGLHADCAETARSVPLNTIRRGHGREGRDIHRCGRSASPWRARHLNCTGTWGTARVSFTLSRLVCTRMRTHDKNSVVEGHAAQGQRLEELGEVRILRVNILDARSNIPRSVPFVSMHVVLTLGYAVPMVGSFKEMNWSIPGTALLMCAMLRYAKTRVECGVVRRARSRYGWWAKMRRRGALVSISRIPLIYTLKPPPMAGPFRLDGRRFAARVR